MLIIFLFLFFFTLCDWSILAGIYIHDCHAISCSLPGWQKMATSGASTEIKEYSVFPYKDVPSQFVHLRRKRGQNDWPGSTRTSIAGK